MLPGVPFRPGFAAGHSRQQQDGHWPKCDPSFESQHAKHSFESVLAAFHAEWARRGHSGEDRQLMKRGESFHQSQSAQPGLASQANPGSPRGSKRLVRLFGPKGLCRVLKDRTIRTIGIVVTVEARIAVVSRAKGFPIRYDASQHQEQAQQDQPGVGIVQPEYLAALRG
jgi:hypothetical protein